MGEQRPAFMPVYQKRLENRVRSKFRHQLTSSSPSCDDWLRKLICRPALGALCRMKKTKKNDLLQRWVNRIWESQAGRSRVNEIPIAGNAADSYMFQGGFQDVLPGCRINFGKNDASPPPVEFLESPVAAGPAPMTAAAISLEHTLSLCGRRQRYKLIRETLGLEIPDWNWLHRQVQNHHPTGDPMDWQQWADVQARVLAEYPLQSRDVVVICLRAIACTKLCGGSADCFGSMDSLPRFKVEHPTPVGGDRDVKMEKFPSAVGLAPNTSDGRFIKIEPDENSWTQERAHGLEFGTKQHTKQQNSIPLGPSRIVRAKSADVGTRTISTPVNSTKPKRLVKRVRVRHRSKNHTPEIDIPKASPTRNAADMSQYMSLGEQMLRQHASANMTDWWVLNRTHSTNNPRNQPRNPTLPSSDAAISRPLQVSGPPSNFHQLVSFYTCAPFLPLPRGNTFVNGWVSSQYKLIQIHDHIQLTKFIDLLRSAHGITRKVDVRVIQIAVGTSTFFFNLSDATRSELEWTMVLGLLLLGNEQVAHVTVGAQLNDLACPLG